jgi:hypothetical protein
MKRRALLAAGLAAPLPALGQPAAGIAVVNVSARNCPWCVKWMTEHKPEWLASRDYTRVRYAEIYAPLIKEAYRPEHWPADLHGILDGLAPKRGVPRFLLVQRNEVVFNEFGMSGWPALRARLATLLS